MSKLDQIESMLATQPNDTFLWFAKAKALEGLGKLEEAIEAYEKLKALDLNYVGLYYHLAHVYAELEHVEKAQNTYEEGIHIATQLKDTHALAELKNAYLNFELENG